MCVCVCVCLYIYIYTHIYIFTRRLVASSSVAPSRSSSATVVCEPRRALRLFSRLARPSRGCFAANGSADAGLLPHALARHTGEPALLSVLADLLVHAADPAPTRPAALPAPQACQGATR